MDCTALAGTIKTFGEYLIFKLCGGAGYQQRLSMAAHYPGFDEFSAYKPIIFLGFIFSAVCFLYFYSHEQKILAQGALEAARRRQSEQEKALLLSQLKQLQSQMEPHFLFNTLANINALIAVEPYKAQLMLEKLTELLRGTMRLRRTNTGDLREEMQLIDAYLGIQKNTLRGKAGIHSARVVRMGYTRHAAYVDPTFGRKCSVTWY